MLMDIGTEELSHLEIIGTLARLHLKPMKKKYEQAEANPLIAVAGGGGVSLYNSMGTAWTADYLKISGELSVDLAQQHRRRSSGKNRLRAAAQSLRRRRHERCVELLMTREIAHMKSFSLALDSLISDRYEVGKLPVDEAEANRYYNDSTGKDKLNGEDATGPWNQGNGWELVESPAFRQLQGASKS